MLATRRKAAGFPTGKTFDAWDPAASSIPRPDPAGAADPGMGQPQGEPRRLRALRHREDVLPRSARASRPSRPACAVAWFTLEDLGALMRAHRADDTVSKAVARILRADLVVIDDIGLLPVGADAAEGLYRIVDAAYEKRSVAISSNLHPAGFDELMPKTLATATVDRLLHHAHVCQTSGDSVRLTQALAGKGVTPTELNPHPNMANPPNHTSGQIWWP